MPFYTIVSNSVATLETLWLNYCENLCTELTGHLAHALDYLHSRNILLKTLNPSVVGYSDNGCFVLTNLSSVAFKGPEDVRFEKDRVYDHYHAPEVYYRKEFSTKSDIYSLALVSAAFQRKSFKWQSDVFEEIRDEAMNVDMHYIRRMLSISVSERPSAAKVIELITKTKQFQYAFPVDVHPLSRFVKSVLQDDLSTFSIPLSDDQLHLHLAVLPIIFFHVVYPMNHLHGAKRKLYRAQISALCAYLQRTKASVFEYVLVEHVPNLTMFFVLLFEVMDDFGFCTELFLNAIKQKLLCINDDFLVLVMENGCYNLALEIKVIGLLLAQAPDSNTKRMMKISHSQMIKHLHDASEARETHKRMGHEIEEWRSKYQKQKDALKKLANE